MKKNKKSQVSIQFNWIFVLIAGAIILLFFVGIAFKQKAISETGLSATVANQLATILTGARLATSSTEPLGIPEIDINFVCDKEGVSEFIINKKSARPLTTEVFFAPDLLRGPGELRAWALPFQAPFKITNFLYLTSKKARYIFVPSSNSKAREIFYELPDEINKELLPTSEIQDLNNDKVKFIFFGQSPSVPITLEDMPDKDVTAIVIGSNKIDFYKKQRLSFVQEGSSFYLNNEMLYAAIFTENLESYECNLKKAFSSFKLVAEIYAAREQKLIDSPRAGCDIYYQGYTTQLKNAIQNCDQNTNSCSNLNSIISKIEDNNQILKQKSCPLLY